MENLVKTSGGKVIISVFIDEADIYSLSNDGSWQMHEWVYEPEFDANLLAQSKIFNSVDEAVEYLIQSDNLPGKNEAEIDSYQIFANRIPTEEEMRQLGLDTYTDEDVVDVICGAYDSIIDSLQIDITDNVLSTNM